MARQMSYFRVKWTRLPDAYRAFVEERLEPGGRVLLINDRSKWPVTRIGPRHVFQVDGQGGVEPDELLSTPAYTNGRTIGRLSRSGVLTAPSSASVVGQLWSAGHPDDRARL